MSFINKLFGKVFRIENPRAELIGLNVEIMPRLLNTPSKGFTARNYGNSLIWENIEKTLKIELGWNRIFFNDVSSQVELWEGIIENEAGTIRINASAHSREIIYSPAQLALHLTKENKVNTVLLLNDHHRHEINYHDKMANDVKVQFSSVSGEIMANSNSLSLMAVTRSEFKNSQRSQTKVDFLRKKIKKE